MPKELLYNQFLGYIRDKRLLKAFLEIPRENFVLPELIGESYIDAPLPIPAGQTISQPTTVMIMIEALELNEDCTVLEIGAGSGYNAALMSKLAKKVYSLEIIEELVDFAGQNLKKTGIMNAEVIHSDGAKGYRKHAPYDRIIVTAAAPKVMQAWKDQLKIGGILLAPVGRFSQKMVKMRKTKHGFEEQSLGDFVFVPLTGDGG